MLWHFRRELIAELCKDNQVIISVPFGDHIDDFKAEGCRMIDTTLDRRGVNPVKDVNLYRFYCNLLRVEKPDLVITYSIKPNIYAGYACRRMGIPYCVNVQGLGTAFQEKGLAELVAVMYKAALKEAKVVFFENQGNADIFRERKITTIKQQCVLNGAGVNLDFYSLQKYPKNDKIHFMYLGRIMREKGISELFSATRRLYEEGASFILDLVGFFEDEYKEQVALLQTEGVALYHGFQHDPKPFYAAADCVVLPSYHEGMSNVLLEASATGRPIITSDIPGCREAVISGESGYLCSVGSVDDIYFAMKKIMILSYAEREAMGLAGRRLMEDRFNKKDVVRTTLDKIYEP